MHGKYWLLKATAKLEKAEIGTARLDCLVLLEDATGKERGWLLAHPEFELDEKLVKKLDKQIKLRATHEPLAYIRHKTEFYGRGFYIDHRVLEPRPESETMIELLKSALSGHSSEGWNLVKKEIPINKRDPSLRWDDTREGDMTIVDLGTGSGALAITAKLEFPAATVIATDIDEKCLDVARQNAKTFGADIEFLSGDLLEPFGNEERGMKNEGSHFSLLHSPFTILANLPYVPDHFQINPAAMAEPRIAIFGGPDGLDLYRKFFKQLKALKQKPQFIFTECMPPQQEALAEIAKSAGFKLSQTDDFIQVFTPSSFPRRRESSKKE